MNLLERTKELCKLHHIIPRRSRGQNFLIKEEIYDDIVVAAELKAGDAVLEVGPGLGFLTAKLAAKVKRVIAVEIDSKLAETLKIGLTAQGIENVEVVNEDILKFSIFNFQFSNNFKIQNSKLKIVANLPYNITSIFLRKFLEAENKPELMILMLQKEVAERICASPREIPTTGRDAKRISRGKAGQMSLLAVSVQFYAQPEIVQIVPKENFWPKPEVDSAIIKLEVRSKKLEIHPVKSGYASAKQFNGVNEKDFFRLVKFGFSAKRKMLKNNLAAGLRISQKEAEDKIIRAGFNGKVRAQELSVDDWLRLFSVFNENVV